MKFELEHHEGGFVGLHTAAVDDLKRVADHCAGLRGTGATGSKEMKHVARVPAFIVQQYINTNGITYQEFINNPVHADRMLSDPALQGFRVWEGKL